VVIGNCSLAVAPVRPGAQDRISEFLSRVEAIPMEVLRTVDFTWETNAQYMDALDGRIGVNVGTLIGHSAVRHYVMGDECQGRDATEAEIQQMQRVVRDGIQAGALGLSVSKNMGHFDPQGVLVPAVWATEEEIFGLGDVLRELGTGIIQGGGGRAAELENRLMSRLAEATGRQVLYNNLNLNAKNPGGWRKLKGIVEETSNAGIRAYPLTTPYMVPESSEDLEALREILNFPSAILGLSDGGAHVQMHGGYGYSTRLLGYWVREQGIMSLEHAVRRLTFESASAFGIYDRGLLRPGMAADVTIFDPATVQTLPEERYDDFPAGGWRIGEMAEGIKATIVNGQVLLEDGKHTGALPGRVVRNPLYNSNA
jgi:N-acyl-D-aspartate/D-glutamate deacylase